MKTALRHATMHTLLLQIRLRSCASANCKPYLNRLRDGRSIVESLTVEILWTTQTCSITRFH